MSSPDPRSDRCRLDRWLWFTRLFKSRARATQAVTGGKVKLNGTRVKPAHALHVGDRLTVALHHDVLDVTIVALPQQRGPAAMAAACYVETPQSVERRVTTREQRRLADLIRPQPDARPDKRQRRQLEKLRRGQGQG